MLVGGGPKAPTASGSSNNAHRAIMAAVPVNGTRFRIVQAPTTIICVDCGGTCHLLAHPETGVPTGGSGGLPMH
ncbi:MAG: hypothetical protein Ct9H300mP12_11100 [Acidimicrobiales bacterium]|nr:MAG: hypothetical protein Ct9H300mP12_11100 [Acidimicrobiales bacterium]